MNIGLISKWHVHAKGYAQELLDSGKVNITAVWDEDAERGKAWAEEIGAEFIMDYDAFLNSDIAAVMCCSPTTMHPELLHKAIAAQKHIFTEKLLAATTEECEKLCKAIDDSGIIFTISLPLRASAEVLYIKKLIDDGTLGKITGARFRRSHSGVSDNWLPDYWFDTDKTGGGAMMDLGAHPVYILSFLLGEPKRLSGMTSNIFGTSSDENAVAVAEFAGGVIATGETAFVTYGVPDLLEVYGTEGSVFMRGDDIQIATKATNGKLVAPENIPAGKSTPIMQFVEACLSGSGTPEYLGTADALVMTKMIEAVYKSDSNGCTMIF